MRSIQYALILVWQTVLLCVMLAVGGNVIDMMEKPGTPPAVTGVDQAPDGSRAGIDELRGYLSR